MRVITCASYYGTGSSAITDLFSECRSVFSFGDYEYRFLQEPDGISDLEYNVVENNHRHNTSDSIKRFLKYMDNNKKFGYGGYDIFGSNYELLVNKYVSDITELITFSWWNKDRIDKGRLFCLIDRVYSFVRRMYSGGLRTEKKFSLLQNHELGYFTAIEEQEFIEKTQLFVEELLDSAMPDKRDFVMVDQMVPPTNIDRYVRYFKDVRVIVVDRDPRDLYLLEKLYWQWGVIPVHKVSDFVKWFEITRKHSDGSQDYSDCILRLKFEDLVYKYDETKERLFAFVGLNGNDHIDKKKYFNPSISIKNTNLFSRHPGYNNDIRYIEEHLEKYIYNF